MIQSKETLETFLAPIKHIVFDCDGVLYRGNTFFNHVPELLKSLSSTKKLYFLTNNSKKSRAEYRKKFIDMGMDESVISDIYSSSYAAALYLKSKWSNLNWEDNGRKRSVFVIGMQGIQEELNLQGIHSFGYEFSDKSGFNEDELISVFEEYTQIYDIKCILIGFDAYFNIFKLSFATLCLLQIPNCLYIATNTDVGLPWRSFILPGTGTLVASLNKATNREPEMICGKPSTLLLDHLVEEHNVDRSAVLMVGDRLETDIRMANIALIRSMAVLSGAASIDDIQNASPIDTPNLIVTSLTDVYESLVLK